MTLLKVTEIDGLSRESENLAEESSSEAIERALVRFSLNYICCLTGEYHILVKGALRLCKFFWEGRFAQIHSVPEDLEGPAACPGQNSQRGASVEIVAMLEASQFFCITRRIRKAVLHINEDDPLETTNGRKPVPPPLVKIGQ